METFLIEKNKEKKLKFKSYYVVWKLFFHFADNNAIVCLNRTMQYGNYFVGLAAGVAKNGLNRTMQYGNRARTPLLSPCCSV